MPRTYGALGPQGDFRDQLIPRPDLAPPVIVRSGPSPSREKRASIGDQKAQKRRARREGMLFREELKRQMRMNKELRLRTEDENRARDFDRRQAHRRAPIEEQMMLEQLRMARAQDPGRADRMAEMEDARIRDLADLEAQNRLDVAGIEAAGRSSRGGSDMDRLIEVLAGAGMGDYALMMLMGGMGPGGPGGGGGGGPKGPPRPAGRGAMGPIPGVDMNQMRNDLQQKMQAERRRRVLEDPAVKNWIKEMVSQKDATWGRRMVGLPEGSEGFWGGMSGAGVGFFGGNKPEARYGNVLDILRQVRASAPGGYGDPDSAKAILSAIVNDPDFYDEFASDVPWAPGNEGLLREEILRMIREAKLR